jgi:NAD(P)-dependent dehydrogenase (short-subunit alcohol dehydrogenase family)/acyl dehydratase
MDPRSRETLRFGPEEVKLFAEASGDLNPLHLSPSFARRTAFGEPVIHGVLGVLSALGALPPRPGSVLAKVEADFPHPMFAHIEYRVRVERGESDAPKIRVYDGRRVVARLSPRFQRGAAPWASWGPRPTAASPRDPEDETLRSGTSFGAGYAPPLAPLASLLARHGLEERGLGLLHGLALVGCSYVVGMDTPGKRALFTRLEVEFPPTEGGTLTPSYAGALVERDERFALLDLEVEFRGHPGSGSPFARAKLRAFARRDVPPLDPTRFQRSRALAGRVAVVVGASRGLGAAIAHALASAGCAVVGSFAHSRPQAEETARRIAEAGGTFTAVEADAASAEGCRRLRRVVEEAHGKLDVLVCNACPSLRSLWIEPESNDRIVDYVARSLSLVSTPMSHLLDLVDAAGGTVAIVSSSVVGSDPPGEWPHYVAAKYAAEALARVAAVEYPRVGFRVVRPPLLLTDLTNTPAGVSEASPVEDVAARIVADLTAARQRTSNFEVASLN